MCPTYGRAGRGWLARDGTFRRLGSQPDPHSHSNPRRTLKHNSTSDFSSRTILHEKERSSALLHGRFLVSSAIQTRPHQVSISSAGYDILAGQIQSTLLSPYDRPSASSTVVLNTRSFTPREGVLEIENQGGKDDRQRQPSFNPKCKRCKWWEWKSWR